MLYLDARFPFRVAVYQKSDLRLCELSAFVCSCAHPKTQRFHCICYWF